MTTKTIRTVFKPKNKAIDTYLSKLIRRGFKRIDTGESIRFEFSNDGFSRLLEFSKKDLKFEEKIKVDKADEFLVGVD